MIRVVVADDQAMVRGGIATMLRAEDDIVVEAEAANGAEAVDATAKHHPDVVLLDVRMPVLDGIAAAARIKAASPRVHVLVLTTFDRTEYLYEALRAGAEGFLLKSSSPTELVRAVRTVAAGDALVDPAMTKHLVEHYVRRPPAGVAPGVRAALQGLTAREADVVRLIAQGLANQEIAAQLHLSVPTVKTHVNALLRKLQLRDRVQVVVFAYESGFIVPGA